MTGKAVTGQINTSGPVFPGEGEGWGCQQLRSPWELRKLYGPKVLVRILDET